MTVSLLFQCFFLPLKYNRKNIQQKTNANKYTNSISKTITAHSDTILELNNTTLDSLKLLFCYTSLYILFYHTTILLVILLLKLAVFLKPGYLNVNIAIFEQELSKITHYSNIFYTHSNIKINKFEQCSFVTKQKEQHLEHVYIYLILWECTITHKKKLVH